MTISEYTHEQITSFLETGIEALYRLDPDSEEAPVCRMIETTASDCMEKFRDKVIQDTIEAHPNLSGRTIEEITNACFEHFAGPFLDGAVHNAGHYYIALGVGMAIRLEVK